jgi:hypothetical protein
MDHLCSPAPIGASAGICRARFGTVSIGYRLDEPVCVNGPVIVK